MEDVLLDQVGEILIVEDLQLPDEILPGDLIHGVVESQDVSLTKLGQFPAQASNVQWFFQDSGTNIPTWRLLATVPAIIDAGGFLSFASGTMQPRLARVTIVFLFLLTGSVMAGWTPPADDKITETQLQTYLDTQKDWLEQSAKILQGSSTTTTAPDAGAGDEGFAACLDRHHLSKEEFDWIGQRASDAWSAVAYLDGAYKADKERLDAEGKQLDDTIAAAQKQLAIYQEAKANGWRILNADDRAAAVKSAEEDQRSAMEEVKRWSEDAAAAESDAVQHDADAKSAADQAANPPADVSADDRAEYIENKKIEAAAARASAKEARVEEADSMKSQAEAQTLADAAAQQAAHPEIPVTDDEKNLARSDNDAAILLARNTINAGNQRKAEVAADQAGLEETAKAITKGVPAGNIALLRGYGGEYKKIIAEGAGTTREAR
jgi:hypothetical protein